MSEVSCRVNTLFGSPYEFARCASSRRGSRFHRYCCCYSVPPTPHVVPIQEATSTARVDASATSTGFIAASLSTVATPLLSVSVVTTSALVMSPPPFSPPPVPPIAVLVVGSPSSSSRPHVLFGSLVHFQRC